MTLVLIKNDTTAATQKPAKFPIAWLLVNPWRNKAKTDQWIKVLTMLTEM
jgi:hypothetical protein